MLKVFSRIVDIKSDGSETPSALVDMALEKGLAAFALTDHDTTDGLDDALAYAADKDIEVIPGIEFSTEYEGRRRFTSVGSVRMYM